MKLTILTLLLDLAGILLHIWTPTFDLAAYKNQYRTEVTMPYKAAINVLSSDIIKYLAITPVPSTGQSGRNMVAQLNSRVTTFSSNLAKSFNASDRLRRQLDTQVATIVSQGSSIEQQLKTTEKDLAQTNAQIKQSTAQLVDAQHQVKQVGQSVQHSEQKVREARAKLDRAMRCRRKRFIDWSTFKNKVLQPIDQAIIKPIDTNVIRPVANVVDQYVVRPIDINVIKPVGGAALEVFRPACIAINALTGELQSAVSTLSSTQNHLNVQQKRQVALQSQLALLKAKEAQLQATKSTLVTSKVRLGSQQKKLIEAQKNINAVNIGLKMVMAHLGSLHGKSQVLKDVITKLIDMETMINPLVAIADQIVRYTENGEDARQMNAMKEEIMKNVPLAKMKLRQYDLVPMA